MQFAKRFENNCFLGSVFAWDVSLSVIATEPWHNLVGPRSLTHAIEKFAGPLAHCVSDPSPQPLTHDDWRPMTHDP